MTKNENSTSCAQKQSGTSEHSHSDIIEALGLAGNLIDKLDSISMEDISEDLSDAIYDSEEALDNLVSALDKESSSIEQTA